MTTRLYEDPRLTLMIFLLFQTSPVLFFSDEQSALIDACLCHQHDVDIVHGFPEILVSETASRYPLCRK